MFSLHGFAHYIVMLNVFFSDLLFSLITLYSSWESSILLLKTAILHYSWFSSIPVCERTIIYLLILLVWDSGAASIFLPWTFLAMSHEAGARATHISPRHSHMKCACRIHVTPYPHLKITSPCKMVSPCDYKWGWAHFHMFLCHSCFFYSEKFMRVFDPFSYWFIFLFNLLNNNPLLILCVSNIFFLLSIMLLLVLKHLLNRSS